MSAIPVENNAKVVAQLKEKMFATQINVINDILRSSKTHHRLVAALNDSRLGLKIREEAMKLCVDELIEFSKSVKRNLKLVEINSLVEHCNAVAGVSLAANDQLMAFNRSLLNADAHLVNVSDNLTAHYQLVVAKYFKLSQTILSGDEIQFIIDQVNQFSIQITGLQARARGFLTRKRFEVQKKQAKCTVDERVNNAVQRLVQWKDGCPPMILVREALLVMDITEEDFALELEIQKVTDQIVNHMRANRSLQDQINDVDQRIGALVRNSVETHSHLRASHLKEKSNCPRHAGINDFSKDGQAKLKAYGHLVYLLQTKPTYMSRLLLRTSLARINGALKLTLYAVFGWGASPRNAYWLLNFFKTTLVLELERNVSSLEDLFKESPLSIDLSVDLYRYFSAQLISNLRPLIMEVLDTSHERWVLDPVVVYNDLRNATETESGKVSDVRVTITAEEALQDDEVKRRLDEMYKKIVHFCTRFVDLLTSEEFFSVIPYGICCICKAVYDCLREKFKEKTEKDLFKVVGHVFYYRFLNPYIVTPDAFGVILNGRVEIITMAARANLLTISKFLQSAVNGKKSFNFGSLQANNFYHSLGISLLLSESSEKFRNAFSNICQYSDPEEYYNMNELSDELLVVPPQVSLNVKDIYQLHHWLHHFRNEIASSEDVFHEILQDCGPPPTSPIDLVSSSDSSRDHNNAFIDVHIPLSSKYQIVLPNSSQVPETALRLKQAIVELVRARYTCQDLNEVFFKAVHHDEEARYARYKERRTVVGARQTITLSEHGQNLYSLLNYVKLNLKAFNAEKFEDILQQIVNDVISQIQYRNQRRKTYNTLRNTSTELARKTSLLEDTFKSYDQYLKSCMENLNRAFSKSKRKSHKSDNIVKYKCTAAKLMEKQILVSLKDVETGQLKSIYFTISYDPETQGIFDVAVNYRGLLIESVKINLQDLLQLQFDGYTIFQVSRKATVNVNLLVHFLNHKFNKSMK